LDAETKTLKNVADKTKSWDIEEKGKSRNVRLDTTNARWFQLFKFTGGRIVNERGSVVAIEGGKAVEGANIITWTSGSDGSQQWELVYADTVTVAKPGELNDVYGFFVERPFYLASQLPRGRYLEVLDGTRVVTKNRNGHKEQLWSFDEKTHTVRSYTSKNLAWTKSGSAMRMSNAVGGGAQDFKFTEEGFVTTENQNLDAVKDEEGYDAAFAGKNNSPSQKWTIVYEDEAAEIKTKGTNKYFGLDINRNFFIVSKLPMERAVTASSGTLTQTDLDRTSLAQQFYFDGVTKTIKSAVQKDNSITIYNNGKGPQMKLTTTTARWWQIFRFENGSFVCTKTGQVWNIRSDAPNSGLEISTRSGGSGEGFQVWYADDMPPEPKKGDKKWGMKIETPFYVQHVSGSGRFLDVLGNNMVIKTRNGYTSQQWTFNWKTRTINNVKYGKSWDISNSGKGNNMQLYNTNSKWWQLFQYYESAGQFANARNSKVIDAEKDSEGASVILEDPKDGAKWKLIYADEIEKIKDTGLNKNFGLEINRPFFI
jgi:hypothetical protein